MGDLGEDLSTKLRRVLQSHHVHLEPAAAEGQKQQHFDFSHGSNSSQDSGHSNDPTIAYISKMLLEDDVDDGQAEQATQQQKSYQGLLDEFTGIVSPELTGAYGTSSSPSSSFSSSSAEEDGSRGGIDIYWTLMQCARAVAANNGPLFYQMVRELKEVVSVQPGPIERASLYFIDALVARLTGTGPQAYRALAASVSTRKLLNMRMRCVPSFVVGQIFANENILRACRGAKKVHIVDYGIFCGYQWPQVIQAFSERPEGPPQLKITGIDLPELANLPQTASKLHEFAKLHGVQLEYCCIPSDSWELAQPASLYHPNEVLIVNSNLRLRSTKDGSITAKNPRKLLFEKICKMNPKLFVQCVLSTGSSPFFIQRFEEALRHQFANMEYYNTWLEDDPEERFFMQQVIAKSIMNVVACDGSDITERPDFYRNWGARAIAAGFSRVPLDDDICDNVKTWWGGYKHNQNFGYGKDENWLLLGWKDEVILGMSAWKPKSQFI